MQKRKHPTLGVVAGSGTLSSLGAIKLFEFLQNEDLIPDFIVGCSGGAMASALWSLKIDLEEAFEEKLIKQERKLFKSLDYRTLLNSLNLPVSVDKENAILKPHDIQGLYRELFGQTLLEELTPKLLVQTTDLDTGEDVVLEKGSLANALYATTALYPLLPPIAYHNRFLVDGGYSSPLPILEAVKRMPKVIIAISMHIKVRKKPKNFIEHTMNFFSQMNSSVELGHKQLAKEIHIGKIVFIDVFFDKAFSLWDVHEIPYILKTTQKAVELSKKEIFDALAIVS